MRHVKRSALVPYSAQQMFLLVDDVESYEKFLPWCNSSVVNSRTNESVEATLDLHKGGVNKEFTTRNSREEWSAINIDLLGGPFKHLAGGWRFDDLGDQGCKVQLKLDFEFDSMLVDMMFGAFFEETCNSLVDAFTMRAAEVFGPR